MEREMPFADREGSREEACRLVVQGGVSVRLLCARFGVSPTTLYKWVGRYREAGRAGLKERSRRPHVSPRRSAPEIETAVLAERLANPAWGGRKIAASLKRQGLGCVAPSTVTAILHRHGASMAAPGQQVWRRFERETPNALWQMDFKGHVEMGRGRLHPLTIVDDHSRYAVGLAASCNEQSETVQAILTRVFERYGLPDEIQTDNGSPWGDTLEHSLTRLGVWLIEHGVERCHIRPKHPQSNGKNERFNRTLKAELLAGRTFRDTHEAQAAFDAWRHHYNQNRPHDALNLNVPAERYTPSSRSFRHDIAPFEYGPDDILRKVDAAAFISLHNRRLKASKALIGKTIALRPTTTDGVFDLVFRHVTVKSIDLNTIKQD